MRQLPCAGLHLLEQPDVLDRDHRLVGEGLDDFDLLGFKRSHGEPEQINDTKGMSIADERHAERALNPMSFCAWGG